MAAKYFNFIDGQRLPGARVKEFLMNQAVIQCENQTEITGSGIEALGARVAINLEDGQLWTYTPDIEAWAPAQNTLDLDLLDARYYTKIAADGVFISETTADARYLTEVTARGIFLSTSDADTKYYTKLQADGLFLSQTTADGRYYTKLQADGLFMTETETDAKYVSRLTADELYLGKVEAGTTYTTKIEAGNLYIAKTTNAGQFVTSISGDVITTGTINANLITSGTLTGRTVRTSGSASDQRVNLATDGRIVFFRAGNSGTPDAVIEGGADGANVLSLRVSGSPSTGINIEPSGTTVLGSGTFTAGGQIFAGDALAAQNLRTTSVRYVTTLSNQTGRTQLGAIVPSDERIKENIEPTSLGLNFVNDINPVEFEWINKEQPLDEGKQFGVIAQQVKSTLEAHGVTEQNGIVYKSFNSEDENDYLYLVNRDQLIGPMIKAIQELSAKNDALEARLAALEGGAQ
jgi:hypothetical protein